ncbi:GNAT family N-acetyltransferase [Haloarchaeobius baliensis]|uniref:GNAT family N-acetyltransferase n=1 Tax=Haloarchaeobius baliensis TaxID=1670458 RepID=UPI003F88379D
MPAEIPCEKLAWDTDFFGFGVGKVTAERVDPETLAAVDEFCHEHDIEVVFYLADADDMESAHHAEDAGYRFVDDRITLDRDLDELPESVDTPATFRTATDADIPALRKIAGDVFRYDRFHADPGFDDEQADEMRATWTENMCGDLGDRVIVADIDGRVGGFIALELDDGVGKIVLTGVDEFAQGENVGSGLTVAALQWFREEGCDSAAVVTQGRNIPAQRIYQKLGYRTADSKLWFHKWFR